MAFRTNKTPVLQTKSASGSVASFNTALAMPLSSCNIAVNAWQEGSGDPSPDNVRPIHGWIECNTYQRGINLWDEQWEIGGYYNDTGLPQPLTDRIRCKNAIPIKQNTKIYTPFSMAFLFYDINNNVLPSVSRVGYSRADNMYLRQSSNTEGEFLIPQGAYYMRFYLQASYGTTYNNDISINYPSTDKSYHPYDSNSTTYTIQLGQEVYGAEVDVVNGVAHVNKAYFYLTGDDIAAYGTSGGGVKYINFVVGVVSVVNSINALCNQYMWSSTAGEKRARVFGLTSNSTVVRIYDTDRFPDKATAKTEIDNNPIEIVIPLAEPFDIQLTPTQIETIIGNNTIFADTGDIDLTFKDLDIAKRGNFREVFKLPS